MSNILNDPISILNSPQYLEALLLDYLEAMGEDNSILNNNDIREYVVNTGDKTLIVEDIPEQKQAVVSPQPS